MGFPEEDEDDLAIADGEMPLADPSDPLKGKLYPYLRERKKRQQMMANDRADLAEESTRRNQGALLAALSKSGNMLGSLGGKVADSSVIPELNKQLGNQFDSDRADEMGMRKSEEKSRQFEEDQYTKRQALYEKLRQKKSRSLSESDMEGYMFDKEKGYVPNGLPAGTKRYQRPPMSLNLPSVQEYTNEAGDVLAGQKVGGRVIKSPTDTVLKPAVASSNKNLSDAAGKAEQIANYLETQLKIYDSKKDEQEKIRLGRGLLKGMNSAFGPDAIGKDEAQRLGGSLEYGMDLAGKGLDPRPSTKAFRQQIVDQIAAQRSAASMNRKTATTPRSEDAPSGIGAPPPGPPSPSVKDTKHMTDDELRAELESGGG